MDDLYADEWGGSCFGATSTMLLTSYGKLDIGEFGAEDGRYYSLKSPKDNLALRDVINFYHLMQNREDCRPTIEAHSSFSARYIQDLLPNGKILNTGPYFWKIFLSALRTAVKEKRALMFSMGYKKTPVEDGSGHAVVACGIDETDEDYIKVKLYDLNNTSEYLYLYISKDYEHFFCSYKNKVSEAQNNTKYASDTNWTFLRYRDEDDFQKMTDIASAKSKSSKMKMQAASETPENTSTVCISAFTKLRLESSDGRYIYYDGKDFTGDMKLYDIRLYGEGANQKYQFVLDSAGNFKVTPSDVKVSFSVFMDNTYYSAHAANADEISIDRTKGITISGKDITFSGAVSDESNEKLVKVSGESEGDVVVKRDGTKVDVKSEGNLTDTTVDQVTTDGESSHKSFDNTDNITVDTEKGENNKPSGEDKKPAGDKSQNVKAASISVSSNPSSKIAAGKKVKLTATVSPANAANKTVTWTSSNTKVATISGKNTVKAGKTLKLKGKVTATKKANKKLKWKSSNTKYATVSSSGKVKALKTGKGICCRAYAFLSRA